MPQSRGSQGPRLFCAVRGAALAMLTSQLFNLAMIVLGFVVCAKRDRERSSFSLRFRSLRIPNYLAMLLPILSSEFLWSLGQNVESAVYGHIGTASLVAYTLTCPIQGLVVGALSGLSAAAGVMVGKRLGRKEYDEAYRESGRIMKAGLLGAVDPAGGRIYRLVLRRSGSEGDRESASHRFCPVCSGQGREYDPRRGHHPKRWPHRGDHADRYGRNVVPR